MTIDIRRAAAALATITLLTGTTACDAASIAAPKPTTSSIIPTLPPSLTPTPGTPSTSASAAPAAQAEAVYRQVFAEQMRLVRAGGIAKGQPAPESLQSLANGQALSWIMGTLDQAHTAQLKIISGENVITAVKAAPSGEQHEGSSVTLHSCEDGSSLVNELSGGRKSHGNMSFVVSSYKVVNGKATMVYYNDDTVVPKCPIA